MTNPTDNPLATLTEYELHHLVAHLEAAGRDEEIHRLLALETSEKRNAWYEARERQGQTAGYLADVTRAWRLAEAQVLEGLRGVGLVIRYALIMASLNSLTRNVSPVLLATLVEKGIWLPAQGLAYARQMSDWRQQIGALTRLIPHLLETERARVLSEALAMAQKLVAERRPEPMVAGLEDPLELLMQLAVYLPEPMRSQVFQEALATAREITEDWERRDILIKLASHLPEIERHQILEEVLRMVGEIEEHRLKEIALSELVAHLPEPLLQKALMMAQEVELDRWPVVNELAFQLAELGHLEEAMKIARNISDRSPRVLTLIRLISFLPEFERVALIIHHFQGAFTKKSMWEDIVFQLTGVLPQEVLEALARGGLPPNNLTRAYWYTELVPWLIEWGYPEEAMASTEMALREIRFSMLLPHKRQSVKVLVRLMLHLPEIERLQILPEALATVRGTHGDHHVCALMEMWPYLPEDECRQALREVLAVVQKIDDKKSRKRALRDLRAQIVRGWVQNLSGLLGLDFLRSQFGGIKHKSRAKCLAQAKLSAEILTELAPYWPEIKHLQTPEEALAAIREIKDNWKRKDVLARLASQLSELDLPKPLLYQVLAIAWETSDEERLTTVTLITRADLLENLRRVKPIILRLGGVKAISETICAIQDVGHWWP